MRLLQPLSRLDRRLLSTERGIERRYRIRERLNDGAVYRTFWFDDRDDADAFLWAAITGSLRYERDLWRLPVPCWEPGWPDVTYDFVTQAALTSVSAGNQNYTVASDFNAANNNIQAVGSGGSGGIDVGGGRCRWWPWFWAGQQRATGEGRHGCFSSRCRCAWRQRQRLQVIPVLIVG
jgi:hypothetical protein